MSQLLIKSICSGLLLCGLTVAQQYPPRADDRYREDRDRTDTRDPAAFMERIRADLDRAQSTASPFSDDGYRIDRVRDQMSDFQRRLDAGTYDSRQVNEMIVSLQRVVDNNRVYDRVRESLIDDLARLRDLRARYEGWR